MRTIITIILLAAVLISGCTEMPEQIQLIEEKLVVITPTHTPTSTPIPAPTPTPTYSTPAAVTDIQEPQPEVTPIPSFNPDKIKLKFSCVPHPDTYACGTCAILSLIIFNEGETNLTNLIIYFVQSGGKEPDSWHQLFYNIPVGKSVWEKILVRKNPEYWTDMSYYIELDGKMVELTNYETSWD